MQRRVKLSRFSLAFEIDFFVSQKVQPHTYLKAWGNFITSLRPQRVAVVELDSGDASQAHDDAQPVRHPEVPDGLVHVLDQNRHTHYNQLNFVTLDFSQPMTCEFHSTQKRNSLPLCDSDLFLPQNR